MKFDKNSILLINHDVIARSDTNGRLLFQVSSDEIYFVSEPIYKMFLSNCYGSATLGEMLETLNVDEELIPQFMEFIYKLVQRKIIDVL